MLVYGLESCLVATVLPSINASIKSMEFLPEEKSHNQKIRIYGRVGRTIL